MTGNKTEEILGSLPYLTKQNLGLALGKKGEALNYWIKKWLREGRLLPLKKGCYVGEIYWQKIRERREEEAYREYLSNLLRSPSYLSLQYVLSQENFIPETAFHLTAITSKTGRSYQTPLGTFSYRHLKPALFGGWRERQWQEKTIKIASLGKALFDFLYLRRFGGKSELAEFLFQEGRFNWEVFSNKEKKIFTNWSQKSGLAKMKLAVYLLKGGGML